MNLIGVLIAFIIVCLIAGFLFWAIQQVMALVSVAEPFRTFIRIALAAIVLLLVIWFILIVLGMAGVHVPILPAARY